MIQLLLSACIEAPIDKTWAILAKVEQVNLWVEPILTAYCDSGQTKGVGTVRTCNLKGNITIQEKWIEWDDGHSFTYLGYNIPMVQYAKNRWSVSPVNGKTLVTTESEVELSGGLLGSLIEPFMRLISKRMGADSLAALKFLVETGHPYNGKPSSLPRALKTC